MIFLFDLILAVTFTIFFVGKSATANSDPLESRFFIILEMLMSTLEDKLAFWRRGINKTMSVWCGPFGYCCANKPVLNSIWMERIHVTKCIASAIQYLHNEDIIYRDLVSTIPSHKDPEIFGKSLIQLNSKLETREYWL